MTWMPDTRLGTIQMTHDHWDRHGRARHGHPRSLAMASRCIDSHTPMAYIKSKTWNRSDIRFRLVDEDTSDPVVTIEVATPRGSFLIMAEPREDGR